MVLEEPLEDGSNMANMLLEGAGKNLNAVQVNRNAHVEQLIENVKAKRLFQIVEKTELISGQYVMSNNPDHNLTPGESLSQEQFLPFLIRGSRSSFPCSRQAHLTRFRRVYTFTDMEECHFVTPPFTSPGSLMQPLSRRIVLKEIDTYVKAVSSYS
ncbi:uncharacterized [Tachysurus ichikawai]